MNSGKHPLKVVRRDRVLVAVWSTGAAESGVDAFVISTWRRSPEDADWRRTDSFRTDELPLVAQALLEAHVWILSISPSDEREAAYAN